MPSLRLTFAHEGRRIELVSAQFVDGIAPTPPVSPRGIGGFWLEVRGGDEQTLFERTLQDPFGESPEFPTGDPERPFQRATVQNPSGSFEVMVPDLEGAVEVALFEGRAEGAERFADEGGRLGQAPIARFALPPVDRGRE